MTTKKFDQAMCSEFDITPKAFDALSGAMAGVNPLVLQDNPQANLRWISSLDVTVDTLEAQRPRKYAAYESLFIALANPTDTWRYLLTYWFSASGRNRTCW